MGSDVARETRRTSAVSGELGVGDFQYSYQSLHWATFVSVRPVWDIVAFRGMGREDQLPPCNSSPSRTSRSSRTRGIDPWIEKQEAEEDGGLGFRWEHREHIG